MTEIGFIGLGTMGLPMAGHLAADGHRPLRLSSRAIERRYLKPVAHVQALRIGGDAKLPAEGIGLAELALSRVVAGLPIDPRARFEAVALRRK